MLFNEFDDQYLDDDFSGDLSSNEDSWDNISGDDIPEDLDWLEEVENEDLDDYSFEDDFDDLDLEDI
jgi:hypothetical protein